MMKVADLVLQNSRSWNVPLVESLVSHEDAVFIQNIKLSEHAVQDCLIWPYTKDMKYSVKSGNWVATHDFWDDDPILPPVGSLLLKSKIWKLNILPKIKHFLWRVMSGALSTSAQLCSRGVQIDPICQRCCLEDETINHVLFMCPYAMATWRCSNIPIYNRFGHDIEDNIALLFQFLADNRGDEDYGLLPFRFLWYIWKSSNEFLFTKRNVQPILDAQRAIMANAEWCAEVGTRQSEVSFRPVRSSGWEPSPPLWYKCNFGCSYATNLEFAGIGWILRDENGKFIDAASLKIPNDQVQSVLIGESYAFLFALQSMWIRGWRNVWFEGDNQELIRIINTNSWDLDLGNLLFDIRFWMSKLPLCSIDHVNTEKNQAAYIISRKESG